MFHMKKDFVEAKNDSSFHSLVFFVYFCLFYFLHNLPFVVSIGGMLTAFKGAAGIKILTFMAGGLSSWWFHYMAHHSWIFNFFSGHRHHHQEKTNVLEDVHEFASNVIAAGGALLALNVASSYMFKRTFFNNYVLLLFMFAFPLVHLLVYHRVLKESYHEEHHRATDKNFSPDLFDHLFNTNLDNRIENLDHMIPVFAGVAGVLLVAQKYDLLKITMT
jgi:hypothetical protein